MDTESMINNPPNKLDESNIPLKWNDNQEESVLADEECQEELECFIKWKKERGKDENTDRVEAFSDFFIKALLKEYTHYSESKRKAWSRVRNALLFVCGAFLPGFAAFLLGFITEGGTEILASVGVAGATVMILAAILSHIYTEWQKLNAHSETWVRHSACYHRLRLALNRFLVSQRDQEAYNYFEAQVFAIMEQNLDQFVLNMSGRGMATRTHSSKAGG